MFKTIVDELIAIKKELQDIKLILKFHFLIIPGLWPTPAAV